MAIFFLLLFFFFLLIQTERAFQSNTAGCFSYPSLCSVFLLKNNCAYLKCVWNYIYHEYELLIKNEKLKFGACRFRWGFIFTNSFIGSLYRTPPGCMWRKSSLSLRGFTFIRRTQHYLPKLKDCFRRHVIHLAKNQTPYTEKQIRSSSLCWPELHTATLSGVWWGDVALLLLMFGAASND